MQYGFASHPLIQTTLAAGNVDVPNEHAMCERRALFCRHANDMPLPDFCVRHERAIAAREEYGERISPTSGSHHPRHHRAT